MQNFNVSPYFNDYSDDKNFYKTLFVPSRPVQTRELNQIQSILQNQIKSHADHVFQNGSMVIPGHVYYDQNVHSIKLVKLHNDVSADLIVGNLLGKTLVGEDTGVTALVVHYDLSTNTDATTIYVKFISSSTIDENVKAFKNSEVLYDKDNAAVKLKLISASAISHASIVTVNEGIYYVNGYFVRVAKQTITLEKYNNTPTWRAGLEVKESIVTAVEDESLYDNALGYSNYAAPGADRYKIELILSKRSFNFDDLETVDADGKVLEEKFLDLVQVKNGVIIQEVNATAYSEIEKIFARRTFDESGDYEVNPFNINAKEYRNNVRGDWLTSTAYLEGDFVFANDSWWEALNDGVSGPTTPNETVGYKMSDGAVNWIMVNPVYANMSNSGVYEPTATENLTTQRANKNKIVYQVKPGKAYVRGFEVETKSEQSLVGNKAIQFEHVEDEIIPTAAGTYAEVTNLRGLPNISTYEQVDIYYYTRAEIADFSSLRRTATATSPTPVGGELVNVTISDMGFGYDKFNPPAITVSGGGGTGATAQAIISHTGELQEIRIISGGTGYSSTATFDVAVPPVAPVRIGTCRIRSMDYSSGTVGDSAAKYRLQIFDVNLFPDYNWGLHVKAITSVSGGGFAADLVEELVRLPGLVNTTSGTKTITGIGTSFLSNVVSGQYVRIGSGLNVKTSWVVPASDGTLTVPYNIGTSLTSQTIDAVYSSIYSVSASLLAPFTKEFVRNVRSADDTTIDTTYTVRRHFNTLSPTGGVITITLTVDGETFAPLVQGNYLVSRIDTGAILSAPVMSLDPTAKTLTISGLAATAHEVMTTVEKKSTAAREKTKSRAIKIYDVTSQKELEKALITLNEADVYRVVRVMKANGAGTGPSFAAWATASANGYSDITKCFILDNGQTPMFYGLGKLSKKKDCPLLNNTVRIVFEYFNHSAGDFFTVNSYVDVAKDKITDDLRDSIDFRPRIADSGLDFSIAGGASITEPTALNTHFKVDYSYFLPKIDIITIDNNSQLNVVEGESSFSLREPSVNSDSMVIGVSTMEPGTFRVDSASIAITKKDHKRYTMADIGKLARRVSNLEYYAQLSLLEQQTLDKNVTDQNGFDRFKAGILVDDFNSQAICDAGHPDFLCALDFEQGEARAFADVTNVDMKETALSQSQRTANHYTMTGEILSLPYTNVVCIEQPLASRTEFVNPFAVVTFNGEMRLYPSQDSWFEENRRPDIVVEVEGNFNTMLALAESTGVLGTRWNAWQTNWTGVSPARPVAFRRGGWFRGGATLGNQFLTGQLSIGGAPQTLGNGSVGSVSAVGTQDRTGTRTELVARNTETRDDRVVETGIAPFMRSRPIVVRATGMKPNTKVYGFFANIDVDKYVYSVKELVVSGSITGTFATYDDGIVDDEDSSARQLTAKYFSSSSNIPGQQGMYFDRGDVVRVFNGATDTLATAIVVDVIVQTNSTGLDETVVKIIGEKDSSTFNWSTPPTNLTGYSIRNASGNAHCNISGLKDPGLFTNSTGAAYGLFVIPNNDIHKFETGARRFKLIDEKTNVDHLATTISDATYTASGIVQTRQATVTNVRNAELITTQVNESINIALRVAAPVRPTDPLAQTFTVSEESGVFITQAEVYFAIKDDNLPVRCEIRDVVNGYPGPSVIARKSMNPSDIAVDNTKLVPTRFTFDSPVYLNSGVEYCVVLLSDSDVYKVWIARMGETILGTNKLISSQPSLGSLFKSQNNSTWTAEQYEDLTFRLYKAKFDISRHANVEFVNKRLPTVLFPDNAFYAISGSNIVRVFHQNHGFVEGDTVTLSGVWNGPSGPFAALTTEYLAGNDVEDSNTYIVSNTEYDFYTIEIIDSLGAAVNAAYTTQFGGTEAEATYQVMYSTMTPNVQMMVLPNTSADMTVESIKGDPVNAYNPAGKVTALNRENIHYTSMMMVASHDNEAKRLAKGKSAKISIILKSTNENISPIIDSERSSIVMTRNKINNPTLENMNYAAFDDVTLCTNKTIRFLYSVRSGELQCNSFFETTDSTLFDDFDKITTGKRVSVTSGLNNGYIFKVLKKLRLTVGGVDTYRVYVNNDIVFVDGTSTSNCTLVLHNRYVDELAPYNTSALSTYITQVMRTSIPSTGVRVTLDANIPTGTNIEVYHRHMVANSLTPMHEQCWHLVQPTQTVLTTADFGAFTELVYENIGYSAHDVGQIKVVFTSDNPALTPRISAFRMMALA